jgi:hypothetical protein
VILSAIEPMNQMQQGQTLIKTVNGEQSSKRRHDRRNERRGRLLRFQDVLEEQSSFTGTAGRRARNVGKTDGSGESLGTFAAPQ